MRSFTFAALMLVAACAPVRSGPEPQDVFFARLSALCGKAFAGRLASPPSEGDAGFTGQRLIMHVRDCSADTIRIPLVAGEDRSRTWVVTRTASGLELKHEHRHRDGSVDRLTDYGGVTLTSGTDSRQEFPADIFSRQLFVRGKTPQSATNVWAIEVILSRQFSYELRRPNRYFRLEFDLTRTVDHPLPGWGSD
jgi:hypothetical protein